MILIYPIDVYLLNPWNNAGQNTIQLLYYQFLFPVALPELFGRHSLLALEKAVEIGEIVEAAIVSYFGNGALRVYQQTGGITQTDINDIVGKGLACTKPEETAKGDRRHTHHIGQVGQTYLFLIVRCDVTLHLLHAATV